MVFGFDDVVEGTVVAGFLSALYEFLVPAAAIAVESTDPAINILAAQLAENAVSGSSQIVLQDLLGEEGLNAVIDISTGNTIEEEIPEIIGSEFNLAEDIVGSLQSDNLNITNIPGLVQKVSQLINSLASKMPSDSEGFKNLVTDIVRFAMNNPGKTFAVASGVVGTVGLSYAALKKLKDSFKKGEKIPDDIQKLIFDGKITLGDLNKTVSDTTSSILPTSLFGN